MIKHFSILSVLVWGCGSPNDVTKDTRTPQERCTAAYGPNRVAIDGLCICAADFYAVGGVCVPKPSEEEMCAALARSRGYGVSRPSKVQPGYCEWCEVGYIFDTNGRCVKP